MLVRSVQRIWLDAAAGQPWCAVAARAAQRLLGAGCVLVVAAGVAHGQVRIPFPPVDVLIERPGGYVLLPPVKPAVSQSVARECEALDPELAWARLPRPLRELTMREMIGQLLVVSYSGTRPTSKGVEAARLALRRSEISGVLTFRHNIASADETRAVNKLFAEAHPLLPAIIAVDQEGGAVMRVKPSEGGPATPSARDVAKGSLDDAAAAYAKMAAALSDLGFTVNFGPVVDLAVNPSNPVIARFGRAYSASVDTVVRYAKTFIDAHGDAGVATAVKHFPGHGSSNEDSHDRAIDLTATWSRKELMPFQKLIERELVDMVMVGHLELDGVTGPGDLPASLSPVAIDGLLRSTMCFSGVVVSDDLAMDAVEGRWGSPEAARLMIEAGGDIALVSLPAGKGMALVTEITDYLVAKAEESEEFADKIRQAFARVVNHKLDFSKVSDGDEKLGDYAGLAGPDRGNRTN